MKKEFLQKNINLILILAILLITLGFYLKTIIPNHIVFGDEGFHSMLSLWIAENKEYPVWIPFGGTELEKFHFGRPPLLNILQAGFLFIFGSHEIILKLITPFVAVLTGLVVYLFVNKLYDKSAGTMSSIFLVTIPSFVTYAVLVYTEILVTFYFVLFVLSMLMAIKDDSRKYWILSSIFGGLAILTKHTAFIIFVFAPLVALYLFLFDRRPKIRLFQNLFIFSVILLVMIVPFIVRNVFFYQTPLCYPLPFLDNSGCRVSDYEPMYQFETRTTQGGTENSLVRFGLSNYANFAYGGWSDTKGLLKFVYSFIGSITNFIPQLTGLHLASFFVLFGLIGGVILFAMKRGHTNSVLLLLLLTSSIIFYFSNSRAEDTARHTLMWVPFIAITSSVYWNEVYKFLKKFHKHLGTALILFILVIGYQNLVSKLGIMENVKQFSPTFFEACDWVKENLPKDARLMTFWGHRAAWNCQRNISPGLADIRLNNDPESIVEVSKQHGITHFFIQKFSITQQDVREGYSVRFVQLLESNPQYFKKIYENGPSVEDCLNKGVCDGNIVYKVVI